MTDEDCTVHSYAEINLLSASSFVNPHLIDEKWHCVFQVHKTVLDKYGKPDDVFPGLLGRRESLPAQPLSGMYNKSGLKVRLTFKMELSQVWIGTKGWLVLAVSSFLYRSVGWLFWNRLHSLC